MPACSPSITIQRIKPTISDRLQNIKQALCLNLKLSPANGTFFSLFRHKTANNKMSVGDLFRIFGAMQIHRSLPVAQLPQSSVDRASPNQG